MGLRLFLVFFMLGCGATRPISPDAGPAVAVDGGNALVDAGQAPVDGGSVSEDAGASPDPLKTCNSPLDCVLTKTSCCDNNGSCGPRQNIASRRHAPDRHRRGRGETRTLRRLDYPLHQYATQTSRSTWDDLHR